ncbi:MAG: S8 family serine peptidase [Deltaproteobacteria bacterium]|nr:S8 family serine peptidase [Deltaproteobacteria bacterium]
MQALWAMAAVLLAAQSGATTRMTRLDPALRMAARAEATETGTLSKHFRMRAATVGERPLVDLFVKTVDPVECQKIIEQWGGEVRTVAGKILTAALPLPYVEALAAIDIVEYVEAGRRLSPKLNQSLPVIGADDVHAGTGVSQAYTGDGVLVGVVDSGVDCAHADFLDSSGGSRFLAYWDQTKTSDTTGVSEISGSVGTEYTGSELTDGSCASSPDGDSSGHGTHVTGIATSDNSPYTGLAPDASIIVVKHNAQDAESEGTFATTVVDAVNYIFRKAQGESPRMPAVVNLSLGSSLGAHDGTSLFEEALDSLLTDTDGAEKEGRAIVNAAGNENFSSADSGTTDFAGIHATIDQSSTENGYDFAIRSSATVFTVFGGAQVDIWLTSTSACTVQIDAYALDDKSSSALKIDMLPVSKGSSTTANSNTDGRLKIALDFTDDSNANNGKQHALATITKVSGASVTATSYSFDLILIGSCEGDAWLYPDLTAALSFRKVSALPVSTNPRGYPYVSGDSDRTMTIPATAGKVIAVGAFMDAGTWIDLNGTLHDQTSTSEGTGGIAGGISLFSSLGPTADSRTKPDLSAPGEPIIATLASTATGVSSSEKGDATHQKLEGSSMAAPHVTGTVALMLQRNGCLTTTEIKSALTSTATSDSFTGSSLPNNTWGAGKLDTLAAVNAVSAASCEPNNTGDVGAGSTLGDPGSTAVVTTGGGSCTLIPVR